MSVNRNIDKEKGLSYKQIEKRRLKDQKPVIEGFLSWLKQVNPGSNGKLKKAITYINNYLSENVICPVTVGRKNWLFSDTAEGAKANALYLTIVEMAKTYNLNLYDEYSNAIVHAFQKFKAPFSGKIVHIFPEQSAVI